MRKIGAILLILFSFLGIFLISKYIFLPFSSEKLLQFSTIQEEIKQTKQEISLPPPLRLDKESKEAFLTKEGVIKWTNLQREKYGLPPLKENPKLDASAAIKTEEMFAKQYFAHISPTGEGVADLSKSTGYDFILIGENLALGNFENDEALVSAWMNSPGHRENILNQKYQDIGVSVLKCFFDGKMTWLAVQHFGLSLDACPQPDQNIKIKIDLNKEKINEKEKTLENLIDNIKNVKGLQKKSYIEEYNNLVNQYNNLVEETRILTDQYNAQVKIFNDCIDKTINK